MGNFKNRIKNNSVFVWGMRAIFRLFGYNKIRGGRKNQIKIDGIMRKAKINILGKSNSIIIKTPKSNVNLTIFIYGNNNKIIIEENCIINGLTCWIEDDNNEIHIGKDTLICRPIKLMCLEGQSIIIGERCMFAEGVNFRTSDSHSILNSSNQRINAPANIVLANHVWVGYQVLVLKGCSIAENTIIGAKSVVSKSCDQAGVVLAGTPAKIVKTNVNWDYQRIPMGEKLDRQIDE